MKVRIVYSPDNEIAGYCFLCPGCKMTHEFNVNPKFGTNVWKFNGNIDSPSFEPSLLVNKDHQVEGVMQCHSWVTDGKIRFYDNCGHDLKNQIVDLFEIKTD